MAMLSMEDEVPAESPTASSGASSEHTAFAPVASLTASDASSRLEDAVFRCVWLGIVVCGWVQCVPTRGWTANGGVERRRG